MRRRILASLLSPLVPAVALAGAGISSPRVGGLGANSPTEGALTAIYWNPAALTLIKEKLKVYVDLTYTSARGTVQRTLKSTPDGEGQAFAPDDPDGAEVPLEIDAPIPFIGLSYKPTDKATLGFALMAPFGRAGDYIPQCRDLSPAELAECEKNAPTRYQLTSSQLQSVYLSPNLAYEVNPRLSVAVGANVVLSQFAADSALDVTGREDPDSGAFVHIGSVITDGVDENLVSTDEDGDGVASLKRTPLSGTNYSFNVGALYKASDKLHVGASFSSGTRVSMTGTVVAEAFLNGNPIALPQQGDATVSYNLPSTFNAGFRYFMNEKLDIDGWYQFMNYSVQQTIDINLVNFETDSLNREPEGELPGTAIGRLMKNSHAVSIGANYRPSNKARVGGSVMFETSAVPIETISAASIDGNKLDFVAYGQYQASPKLRMTLGMSYIQPLQKIDSTGQSTFDGTFAPREDNLCISGNDPAQGLCRPPSDGKYSVTIARVGLTFDYAFSTPPAAIKPAEPLIIPVPTDPDAAEAAPAQPSAK